MQVYSDKTTDDSSHSVANNFSKGNGNRASAFPAAGDWSHSIVQKNPDRSVSNEIAIQLFLNKNKSEAQRKEERVQPAAQKNESSVPKNNQLMQLFEDDNDAAQKGLRFRELSNQEFTINKELTVLLQQFQNNPTRERFNAMRLVLEQKRLEIKELHVLMVAIVNEYQLSTQNHQQIYFRSYLGDKMGGFDPLQNPHFGTEQLHDAIGAIFNNMAGKTIEFDNTVLEEKSRFLAFMMQGLRDHLGVEQYNNLDQNLGINRNLIIGTRNSADLSGGVEDENEIDLTKKTDPNENITDQNHWVAGGQSGLGFLRDKFPPGNNYNRTPNPNRQNIGDMRLNMDTGDNLLPIFTGVDNHDEMKLFSPPKKMGIHHEVGHINTMLEGKSGGGRKMMTEMIFLSDHEEEYNIWGGPRSDRAYGQELGLPERLNHQSNLGYHAPLDQQDILNGGGGGGGGEYENDFMFTMRTAYGFAMNPEQAKQKLHTKIQDWLNGGFGLIFVPTGIAEMRKVSDDLPAIKQVAINSLTRNSQRTATLTKFYELLSQMNPDSKNAIIRTYLELRKLTPEG